jgi:hypothetical protein
MMRALTSLLALSIALAGPVTVWAKGEKHVSSPTPHPASVPKPHPQNVPKPPAQHPNTAHATSTARSTGEALTGGNAQHLGSVHHGYYRGYNHTYHRYASRGNVSAYQKNRMKHLLKLKSDLESIANGATSSTSHLNTLQHDLHATVVAGTIRPPQPAVQQLSSDLFGAISRRKGSDLDSADMALVLETAMNGNALPADEINQALGSARTIFQSSGVSRADEAVLLKDLKSVAFGTANQAAVTK